MFMLEKRQQWLKCLKLKTSAALASCPEDEHPQWPSRADMENLSKRQWETEAWQLRVKLRELFIRHGLVISQPSLEVPICSVTSSSVGTTVADELPLASHDRILLPACNLECTEPVWKHNAA